MLYSEAVSEMLVSEVAEKKMVWNAPISKSWAQNKILK